MGTQTGFRTPIGCEMIPGGPVGEHRLQGNLAPGDTLLSVEHITEAITPGDPPTSVERKAEFSIVAGKQATIVNTTTDTTGDYLHVVWSKAE